MMVLCNADSLSEHLLLLGAHESVFLEWILMVYLHVCVSSGKLDVGT